MKSSGQIIESIRGSIARLYLDPTSSAYSVCGLDGLLFQLHWLLADATDTMEQFVEARLQTFNSDMAGWQGLHLTSNFHKIVEDPEPFGQLIDEWKRLDAVLGIDPGTVS